MIQLESYPIYFSNLKTFGQSYHGVAVIVTWISVLEFFLSSFLVICMLGTVFSRVCSHRETSLSCNFSLQGGYMCKHWCISLVDILTSAVSVLLARMHHILSTFSFGHLDFDSTVYLLRAFVKKNGKDNVTVDDLVRAITPKGRGNKLTHPVICSSFNTHLKSCPTFH